MTIEYVKKDITTTERGVIAHGVNCQRAMGSGVALAIMRKWPQIRESYMRYPVGPQMLGKVDYVDVEPMPAELMFENEDGVVLQPLNLVVANCWTQEFCGSDGKRYASVDAIIEAMAKVYSYAEEHNLPVVMPLIGCGLAGLDWETEVQPIIEDCDEFYETVDTTICLWG